MVCGGFDGPGMQQRLTHLPHKSGRPRPLEWDLLVVDETSMVDVLLMNSLLRALPPFPAGKGRLAWHKGSARIGIVPPHQHR